MPDHGGLATRPSLFLEPDERLRAAASRRRRGRPFLHLAVLSLAGIATLSSFFVSSSFSGVPITGLAMPNIGVSRPSQPAIASQVLTNTLRRSELEEALQAYAGQVGPQEPALAGTAGSEEPQVVSSPALPYQLYTVAEGDTASAIAARFGIDLQYLLAANAELRDGELLGVGQRLIIPPGNGVMHDVRYGETLSDIADRYGVSIEVVMSWPGNNLNSPDQVVENQLVFVPEGLVPVAAPDPTVEPEQPGLVVVPDVVVEPPPVAAAPPVPSSGLIWPISGPISSYMDGSHPLGIDIDLFNNPYGAVGAATSGTVTFAGGDPCCSYGLYVIVVSPDGIETVYAHFSSIGVSVGQTVNQGDILGNAGCTGYCTGNHLHFEVIDNGVRVNPLSYLP
jgi:murein DD-endopeptidase MepM/ murein hydrolase activator NlpD